MLNFNIKLKNFNKNQNISKIKKEFLRLIKNKYQVINSLDKNYKNSYSKKQVSRFKKFSNFRIIGMGGSILGTQAIHDFLRHKIKKNFIFVDNLHNNQKKKINKKIINLIISKSGNTIETIVNTNILTNKNSKNIFITENKKSYLYLLAEKLKSEIIHHNNFIGGRYSVLSEVGMLPAELMGLKMKDFRQLNYLIKNKNFYNNLVKNVSSTLYLIKKKKYNSIIINYDQKSDNLFKWYQQLIAESLGKKKKGLLPIISLMPKDNHSLMQLYLDGFQNNFFTFFYVHDHKTDKINNNLILQSKKNLKNKTVSEIIYSQKIATENVFKSKKIPFRSFEVKIRNEKTLGELFCFFILETILIGKCLNLNPFDQPAVELIKKETNKLLI
tara:strand:- start:358 stop:1512 length:1155 start_codon:yes stop_codon:yes gene_type:complete